MGRYLVSVISGPRSNGFSGRVLLLAEFFLECLLRVLRQPDLQQVPWRSRMFSTHDDDVGEQFLKRRSKLRADRRRPPDHAAQEPAGAVDAQEADRLQLPATALSARMQPRVQLDTERALRLLAAAARVRHLVGELLPHLVPQPAGLWRGKGHQLDRAVAAPDRDPHAHALGDLDLDLDAVVHRHEQAAEIYPVTLRVAAGPVPRPGFGIPLPARTAGRHLAVVLVLVLAELVELVWVAIQLRIFLGSARVISGLRVPTAAPSEHLHAPNFLAETLSCGNTVLRKLVLAC